MGFSHKLNSAGLRYEIGITIQTGDLVWTNGPYPCGNWPDLRIARNGICDELDPGKNIWEMADTDMGISWLKPQMD
jgi:hypothetical protein